MAVTAFSLNDNKKVLDSLSNVFFSIDLVSANIFNADSLPYGTNVSRLVPYDKSFDTMYDMYFTSYQKNYPVSHLVLKGSILCGIMEDGRVNCREAETHLEQMLAQEGIKNMTVNIFSQTEKYIDRLSRLRDLEADESKHREEILRLLYAISL